MAGKKKLEEQVALLQKQMGGIARMVKDLKDSVETLEIKVDAKESKEIKEILETQKVIDEVIVANSDAKKRIDKEIKQLTKVKTTKSEVETSDKVETESTRCKHKATNEDQNVVKKNVNITIEAIANLKVNAVTYTQKKFASYT